MRELPRLLVAYTWAATKSRLWPRDYQYAVLYILSVSGLHMGFHTNVYDIGFKTYTKQ
jgi:hypothetical protein